ncbi:MAG: T9SS type A sorting domain-containing protein [Saprospiraceae bacterium]|nr:T9SS type A sorting domain-containing protein [Saprospiraceae bacterium]
MRDHLKNGIVIDIDHFGEQPNNELYNKGYTLAHLMGIFLGIRPLWGYGRVVSNPAKMEPPLLGFCVVFWFGGNFGFPACSDVDKGLVKRTESNPMNHQLHDGSYIVDNDVVKEEIENINFSIFNLSGQLMIKGVMESPSKDINVTEWPAGMYYLLVNQHLNKTSNVQKVTFEVIR